jgi:hypothetical protein
VVHVPGIIRPERFFSHIESAAGTDQVQRRVRRDKDVQPLQQSADFPAGFVGHCPIAALDGKLNFSIGRKQAFRCTEPEK